MGPHANASQIKFRSKFIGGMTKCPITCGQPTSMSREGFEKTCRAMRRKIDKHTYEKICRSCKGRQLPEGLTIIELPSFKLSAQTQEDKRMTTNGKKPGTCSCCGTKKKNLRKQYDDEVCTSCQILRIACRNRPEAVIGQLRKLHGGTVPGLSGDQSSAELAGIREILGSGSEINLTERIRAIVTDNNRMLDKLAEINLQLGVAGPEEDPLPVLAGLLGKNKEKPSHSPDRHALRQLGWKLLEGKLDGADHDLSVNDIRLLLGERENEQEAVNG